MIWLRAKECVLVNVHLDSVEPSRLLYSHNAEPFGLIRELNQNIEKNKSH